MLAYQFTLNFDATHISWTGFEGSGIEKKETNFGFHLADEGVITTSWNADAGMTLPDGEELFVLEFKALKDVCLSEVFGVSSTVTPAQAYRIGGQILDVDIIFTQDGEPVDGNTFALYQNQPNPFNGQTRIGFVLPGAMEAQLSVYDMTGRAIITMKGDYKAGYNEMTIRESDLPASGVYYYQLDAEGYSASKKMILTGN
jgi:hypothetical protein